MIKTKFEVENIQEAIKQVIDFEKKLENWEKKNKNACWQLEILISKYNKRCTIIVIVDNEPTDNNKS